ncbi:hypothetical protein [Massilia aquatica]|uniref:HEAT repeat domain-containing protein n=1 Tax=Massilia aquatica TaxID=2609000 RepID=A0ABX0MBN6_9BURK|nr:hypothetical protein [Massilia aquatica]NHZ44606.1 hypothetical protein [Massilia aquatica]
MARFSQSLAAHLEGLAVAGAAGWPLCLAALERWKKPAEAFVAAHTAFGLADASQGEALLAQIRARPDELLRGVISALAWIPLTRAHSVIEEWTGARSDAVMQVAALRSVALIGADAFDAIGQPLDPLLNSSDEHVRAAACRVAALLPSEDWAFSTLHERLLDPVLTVRAEAAIALGTSRYLGASATSDNGVQAYEALSECVTAQAAVLNASTGWYRKQALRRLTRWVQHLAARYPVGQDCTAVLDMLPSRLNLRFIAYHGDSAHLPYVIKQMSIQSEALYAGWVWQTVTGVDISTAGLSLPEPALDIEAEAIREVPMDADLGLARPDVEAIRRFSTASLVDGQRYLLGLALTPANALTVLRTAPQAQRNIAAQYLQLRYPHNRVSVRAPVLRQLATMNQIQTLLDDEGLR